MLVISSKILQLQALKRYFSLFGVNLCKELLLRNCDVLTYRRDLLPEFYGTSIADLSQA